MSWLFKLFGWVSAAPLKDYRTQVLGIATAIAGIVLAVANWSVGDLSFVSMLNSIGDQWAVIVTGLGLWFGGDKVNKIGGEQTTVGLFMGSSPPKK